MMSFRDGRLTRLSLPTAAVWLIGDIMEVKGRQELYARQSPDLLKALREMALIQSVESSNRIEGVTVEPSRLRPLVLGSARPKDRSETEIRGYRRALSLIHTNASALTVTPSLLRRLHKTIQDGAGDAGTWKRTDNDIIELAAGQPPRVRFKPTAAAATSAAIEELCLRYRAALDQEQVPPLLAAAAAVFDFLCIHPFRDGNGRVSRLLTLLILYQHGFEVGRYISLDRIVEEEKPRYYDALQASSRGWHEGRHDLEPWLLYLLSVLRSASLQFQDRAGRMRAPRGAKGALVEDAIEGFLGTFTLSQIEHACPGVSRDMIRAVLKRLSQDGRVRCLARGPGAAWERVEKG